MADGDQWELTALEDQNPALGHLVGGSTPTSMAAEPTEEGQISLLSGGLDSFLGAIHLLGNSPTVTFHGHRDAATAAQGAQARVGRWLGDVFTPVPSYTRLMLHQA